MQTVVQLVGARTGYDFVTSFFSLDRCVKKAFRALASHFFAFAVMLERAGSTVPSITNGEAAEPPAARDVEAEEDCNPTAAGHVEGTQKHAPVAVTNVPDVAVENVPAVTIPTDTSATDPTPTDTTISKVDPVMSCADPSPKVCSITTPHVRSTGSLRHPGTPCKTVNSKSLTPTSSPESVSSLSSFGSESTSSMSSFGSAKVKSLATLMDSAENDPNRVETVQKIDSRLSIHTIRAKGKRDVTYYQWGGENGGKQYVGVVTAASKIFEGMPTPPNKSIPYDPKCRAPSLSGEASSMAPWINHVHTKASDEAADKARRLAWYGSLVPEDYDPNDPSKHWMLHPCVRTVLETQEFNSLRAPRYIPTIEELRASRKVYDAILATGNRISIMEKLGRSSDLIYKAYVTISLLLC